MNASWIQTDTHTLSVTCKKSLETLTLCVIQSNDLRIVSPKLSPLNHNSSLAHEAYYHRYGSVTKELIYMLYKVTIMLHLYQKEIHLL